MRPFWSGSISFGLVNIPVNVYSATDEERIDLDMLHKTDHSRIRYKKVCEDYGHEVPENEIVKGYQYAKGEYVILTKEDLAKVAPEKSKAIAIQAFVKEEEIPTVYYSKPYYLEPGRGASKPYALLREALEESGKVAIIQVVFRTKENLGVVKVHEDGLVLNLLRYPQEIRANVIDYPHVKVEKKELDLAKSLIDSLTDKFNPEKYHDHYREELMKVIEAKEKGLQIARPAAAEVQPTKVIDLMSMLQKSLEQQKAGGERKAGGKKAAAEKKPTRRKATTAARRGKRAS